MKKKLIRICFACVLAGLMPATGFAQTTTPAVTAAATPNASSPDAATKKALEEKLAKYLVNTRWTGQFTIDGQNTPPRPEIYEITQAVKNEIGDFWDLAVRIKYDNHDVSLNMPPIEIKWAGETPVFTVDKVTLPGLGTFDARVLIRSGKYSGTWSHDAVGGHLFGTIEKFDPTAEPAAGDKTNQAKEAAENASEKQTKAAVPNADNHSEPDKND